MNDNSSMTTERIVTDSIFIRPFAPTPRFSSSRASRVGRVQTGFRHSALARIGPELAHRLRRRAGAGAAAAHPSGPPSTGSSTHGLMTPRRWCRGRSSRPTTGRRNCRAGSWARKSSSRYHYYRFAHGAISQLLALDNGPCSPSPHEVQSQARRAQ